MSRGDIQLDPEGLLHSAFKVLEQLTGVSPTLPYHAGSDHDGKIIFPLADGRVVELAIEIKANIDRRDQLSTFKHRNSDAVLVTRLLSRKMIEQCRQLGLQFIDSAGNCYLNQPGLFVFVSGQKEMTATQKATMRGLTPAALRLMFAILGKPSIIDSNVRHMAKIARISHGAAGTALIMFEQIGLIDKHTSGHRLQQPGRWLDIWTEGYLGRLRPKLATYRMSSPDTMSSTLDRFSPEMGEILVGGEAAAAQAQLGIKPGALTLYIDMRQANVLGNLVQELKLRKDANGKIELVEIFWDTEALASFPLVPDALIYADLIRSGDERSLEIASELKNRIVHDVARQI